MTLAYEDEVTQMHLHADEYMPNVAEFVHSM